MIYDIFTNIAILISFLLVIGQLFKNYTFDGKQTPKTQILLGIVFGILGVVLMLFTISMTKTVIIDLRNVSIICAAVLGGPIASMTAAIIIAIFRIILFGVNTASITAHIVALVLGAGVAYMSVLKLSRRNKFVCMFIFSIVVSNAAFIYLIRDKVKLLETLSYYWPVYLFGIILSYFTCEYIASANSNYKSMSYYRMTADNFLDMITAHRPDGIISYVSPTVKQLFGYSPEEFVGTSSYDYIHPEDSNRVSDTYSKSSTDKGIHTQVLRMRHKDGRYIWVETSVKNVLNPHGSIKEMVCVTRDITQRKQAEEELQNAKLKAEQLAFTDYLTGILNRRAFEGRFNEEFNRVEREKSSISIILADIDRFKKINDMFGHQVGDLALQKFSQCLSNVCRPYDFIGRHGGEEFIICLPNTDREQAIKIAERMRKAVEDLTINLVYNKEPIKLTASFGVASLIPGNEESIHTMIIQADRAMYKAKANGRNQVCFE